MKKIPKADLKERDEILGQIQGATEEYNKSIEEYNRICNTAIQKVKDIRTEHQESIENAYEVLEEDKEVLTEALGELDGWLSDIYGQLNDYYEDRSEKWQESEKGENYSDWKDHYDGGEIDQAERELEVNMHELPEIEDDFEDVGTGDMGCVLEEIENLPTEPDC